MPRGKKTAEAVVRIEKTESTGIDAACQTEDWEEDRMRKYRNMKRKLVDLIARKNEYQVTLDKANKRIQTLEKKTRQQQQKRGVKKSNDEDSPMDISQAEDEDEDLTTVNYEDEDEEDEGDQLNDDDDTLPEPKKQRVVSRRKRAHIPRDENGNIVLPFQIASLNVINLGKIDSERPQFHNERYIFPIGYTVERIYMSMVDPNSQTTYRCKVEDCQEGPLFTLSAADAPEIELSARTATGVWALVIKKANEVRQKEGANAISGPEHYGFAHPLIIEMIEELDGVDDCTRYKRKHVA